MYAYIQPESQVDTQRGNRHARAVSKDIWTVTNRHTNTRQDHDSVMHAKKWCSRVRKHKGATSSIRHTSHEMFVCSTTTKRNEEMRMSGRTCKHCKSKWYKHIHCRKAAWSSDHATFETRRVDIKVSDTGSESLQTVNATASLNKRRLREPSKMGFARAYW